MNKKVRLLICYPQKPSNINEAFPLQCYLHLCIPLKLMIDYIFFPKSTDLQFSDYKNDTNAQKKENSLPHKEANKSQHSCTVVVEKRPTPPQIHIHQDPQNETLLGNGTFADIIKVRISRRNQPGLPWGLNSMTGVPIGRSEGIGTQQEAT